VRSTVCLFLASTLAWPVGSLGSAINVQTPWRSSQPDGRELCRNSSLPLFQHRSWRILNVNYLLKTLQWRTQILAPDVQVQLCSEHVGKLTCSVGSEIAMSGGRAAGGRKDPSQQLGRVW